MFWKAAPIPISQEMFLTSGPAMYVVRCLGLFPMSVEKNATKLFLKWSPLYACLSFGFGIITLVLTYMGYLNDVYVGREKSVRMKTQTDIYVQFTDITAVTIVHFFGIFVTPFKYYTFARYVKCLNKIDAIIPPTNLKSDRKLSIFMMSIILIGIFTVLTIDMLMFFRSAGDRQPPEFILKCYTPFYVAYHVMYAHQFLFWHLVYCIFKRIKLLNKHLKNVTSRNTLTIESKTKTVMDGAPNVVGAWHKIHGTTTNENCTVFKLMTVYGKLCDATDSLSRLLGLNTAITLVGILWHLIVLPYFLITSITRDHKDITFTLMQIVWIILTVARLMLIAQPCYNCLLEVQITKERICQLISKPDNDDKFKIQLQAFATVLELRKFEFTASGLTLIDRFLVTSMLGAVTTYLVVLLQVADSRSAS